MNLTLLSKQEAKELEKNSITVESSLNELNDKEYLLRIKRLQLLQAWQDSQGLIANNVKKSWKLLTKLLNTKPLYYVNYEYKNAVWAFGWKLDKNPNNKFILYRSIRGLSIEMHSKFEKCMIDDLLDEIINLLVNKNNLHEILKDIVKEVL